MMQVKKKLLIGLLGVMVIMPQHVYSIFGFNLFRPYDINLRMPRWHCTNWQFAGWYEEGLKTHGYNHDGNEVNPLQLWTPRQDALAMLKGFPASSPMSHFYNDILMGATDDGVRGNFTVTGDVRMKAMGFYGKYYFPQNITCGVYVPLYGIRVGNVKFTDLTANDVTMADILVRDELTNKFFQVVSELDPTLDLAGWSKFGFGDTVIMAEWYRHFPQGRDILKDVALCARLGLNIPTGVQPDEDLILSIPFGFDALGLIFGGGIDLNWFNYFRGGVDFEFIYLFGNTRNRRIKVQEQQTDFLLLAKVQTHKDFGFTQRFNLYLEAHRFFRGATARITYQFWKHDEDTLSLCTNDFSNDIANTAESLKKWTTHHLIFRAEYDFDCDMPEDSFFKPEVALFYKLGLNAERALLSNTVGGIFAVNF